MFCQNEIVRPGNSLANELIYPRSCEWSLADNDDNNCTILGFVSLARYLHVGYWKSGSEDLDQRLATIASESIRCMFCQNEIVRPGNSLAID
jgi:hypothetical protein